ncbi:insulin-like growth factor-binding protein 3 isoform X1 [Alosa alosa]|uniref:insulin-like growth factor-binding protein 3 isoform X1 n=1 Tax=Alosa alosa TaxID=278164 RepID=UPI0020150A0B|nr:insulin-like growth factor-binding protein 3 isoform X1 [Alosa alosa]
MSDPQQHSIQCSYFTPTKLSSLLKTFTTLTQQKEHRGNEGRQAPLVFLHHPFMGTLRNTGLQLVKLSGEKVPGEETVAASPQPPLASLPHLPLPPRQQHPLYHSHAKAEVIRREHAKKTQSFKMEDMPIGPNTDQQNFSLETKPEPEFGPCRREMESILNSLKVTDILNPKGFRIPNCDKKGFYKKRQCRPSNGRKRGFCWCVDKYGQPLPGYKGRGGGDTHCYNLDNQ